MLLRGLVILSLLMAPMAVQAQGVENLIENHSFEDDADTLTEAPAWTTFFSEEDAAGLFSFDGQAIDGTLSMKAEILKSSDTNWHIGLIQPISTLSAGEVHTLTFWAKAEKPRSISMEIKRDPELGGWEGITAGEFQLETDWAEYTTMFTPEVDYADGAAHLDFWLAADDATIWFDFVHVYQGEYERIDPAGFIPQAVDADGKLPLRWAELRQVP